MRAKAIDRNQPEIVDALRNFGATVILLSAVGKGCPDLLVGYAGQNHLLEVKMPKGKLTPDQVVTHSTWGGRIRVVRSAEEAIQAIIS
jgi:hypothetical protein